MWKEIKNSLRKKVPKRIKEFFAYNIGDEYAQKVYSQEGEDVLLKRIFEHAPPGFYVDVGAHHPFRFSNTKLLYDKGWRGIDIDANRSAQLLFENFRSENIFVWTGISVKEDVLDYHIYNHPALNTFNEGLVNERNKRSLGTIKVQTKKLSTILDEYLPLDKHINLLLIDTEGFDFEVLKSNNWDKYIPSWILVETESAAIEKLLNSDIYLYLQSKNYSLHSKLHRSALFKLE